MAWVVVLVSCALALWFLIGFPLHLRKIQRLYDDLAQMEAEEEEAKMQRLEAALHGVAFPHSSTGSVFNDRVDSRGGPSAIVQRYHGYARNQPNNPFDHMRQP